jgi:hypothetical protein
LPVAHMFKALKRKLKPSIQGVDWTFQVKIRVRIRVWDYVKISPQYFLCYSAVYAQNRPLDISISMRSTCKEVLAVEF